MSRKLREIVEEDSYDRSCTALGGSEVIDEALQTVIDGLTKNAEGFDLVPGFEPRRVAKTKRLRLAGGRVIKPLRIWFHIGADDKIHLVFVETMIDPDDI